MTAVTELATVRSDDASGRGIADLYRETDRTTAPVVVHPSPDPQGGVARETRQFSARLHPCWGLQISTTHRPGHRRGSQTHTDGTFDLL